MTNCSSSSAHIPESFLRAPLAHERHFRRARRRRVVDRRAMTTIRPFTCDDLFTYNDVNTDVFTETFNLNFYLTYLATWPEYFSTAESPSGGRWDTSWARPRDAARWHGHVSAVTVAPPFRRMGLAKKMMDELESIGENVPRRLLRRPLRAQVERKRHRHVRGSGVHGVPQVLDYYSGEENAYDMRKALPRRDPECNPSCRSRGPCILGNSERTSLDDARDAEEEDRGRESD